MRGRRGSTETVDAGPAVYFLSDYGTTDEFVGVVHAVLHAGAPAVPVIDLGHQVPPFDVGAGAAMLVRCAPYLGSGVLLAVVDPGVGTDRRGVAVDTGGHGPTWLVGPDNGLLLPLAGALGGVRRAIALRPPTADAGGPTPTVGGTRTVARTFDGRDLFAPAAAHLVVGKPPMELGNEVDPASLVPGPADLGPDVQRGGSGQDAREATWGNTDGARSELALVVTWIDRFGNVQLGIGPEAIEAVGVRRGGRVRVTLPGPSEVAGEDPAGTVPAGTIADHADRPVDRPARSEPARWVDAFGELEAGELGLLVDGNGRLAMVLCQASAADHLTPLSVGDTVWISADRASAGAG